MTEFEANDRRVQRTLNALRNAFFQLVLAHPYDEIKVSHIIEKANVGRSTFYQHFSGKDDILAVSLNGPMSQLANSFQPQSGPMDIQPILLHFWENRHFSTRILNSSLRKLTAHFLADKIEIVLKQKWKKANCRVMIPHRLNALALAESQLTLITGWLSDGHHSQIESVAKILHRLAQSSVEQLLALALQEQKL